MKRHSKRSAQTVPYRPLEVRVASRAAQVSIFFLLLSASFMIACKASVDEPPLGRFGVCAEWAPDLQRQLDGIGPVWYYDYRYDTPTVPGHQRVFMVRRGPFGAKLAEIMRANRGAWWVAGNEPNDPHQDNRSPAEYARFYHDFFEWAKGVDRSCKVIPAGIAGADWRWARQFREEYRRLYGCYPPVEAWNIHYYNLDPGLDPYDVGEFKRRIIAFRHWMKEIGEAEKPLFLSEFGVLYGAGCCERPIDPPEKAAAFMRETVEWLAATDYVQHWAWFILNNARDFNGGLYDNAGKLTPCGEAYRELVLKLSEPAPAQTRDK